MDYTAAPGIHNIWIFLDGRWHLLLDENLKPLEFASSSDAELYTMGDMRRLPEVDFVLAKNSFQEGSVEIKPAPTKIHPKHFLRQSPEEVQDFLKRNRIEDPLLQDIISKMLMALDGAEQGCLWYDYIKCLDRVDKIKALRLSAEPGEFADLIRALFVPESYHCILARLTVHYKGREIGSGSGEIDPEVRRRWKWGRAV